MTTVPQLVVANPTTRPAVTFDRWWVQTLVIRSPGPAEEANATCILAAYSSEDGSLSGETVQLDVADLRAGSLTDPKLAAAWSALVEYVQAVAKDRGLVP